MALIKTQRQMHGSVNADEPQGADAPKVKEEEGSDEGEEVVLREKGSAQSKLKAAVAAPQKETVVGKAEPLASEGKPMDNDSER